MYLKQKILVVLKLLVMLLAVPVNAQQLTIAYGLENYNFQQIFDGFTANNKVKLSVRQFKNNELKSALLQSANMQQLPDIVIVPADFIGLTELHFSTIPNDWLHPELSKESLKSAQVDDTYKGIPIIYGNHLLLYYNKSFISEPATNWQDLLQQESTLPEQVGLIGWNYLEMYWFIPFLGVFNEFPYKNGVVNLDNQGMSQALDWYRSFSENKVVDKDCGYECNDNKFINGELAYTINGSWAFNHYKDELKETLGVALLPNYQGQRMRPYFSSHVLAFPNNSINQSAEKRQALNAFALYLQQQASQLAIWQQMRSLPTNSKIKQQLIANADPNLQVILEQLARSEPMPTNREMAIIWEAMLKGVNRYMADIFDNEKAAEYMQYIADRSINHEE